MHYCLSKHTRKTPPEYSAIPLWILSMTQSRICETPTRWEFKLIDVAVAMLSFKMQETHA